MVDFRNYAPSERPDNVPEGYVLCSRVGTSAKVDFFGFLVSCIEYKCPRNNTKGPFISWDGEKPRRVCMTKGLIRKTEADH